MDMDMNMAIWDASKYLALDFTAFISRFSARNTV